MDVAHQEQLAELNCRHLTRSVDKVQTMVHRLKPTMSELLGTNHAIKVGDWVEVLYEYGPGICSDGGVGTVASIETTEVGV